MQIVLVALVLIAAVAAVLWPLLRRDAAAPDPTTAGEEGSSAADIAREVARYRVALRAGSVCRRCAQANPPHSRFCSECGRPLRRRHVDATTAAGA